MTCLSHNDPTSRPSWQAQAMKRRQRRDITSERGDCGVRRHGPESLRSFAGQVQASSCHATELSPAKHRPERRALERHASAPSGPHEIPCLRVAESGIGVSLSRGDLLKGRAHALTSRSERPYMRSQTPRSGGKGSSWSGEGSVGRGRAWREGSRPCL